MQCIISVTDDKYFVFVICFINDAMLELNNLKHIRFSESKNQNKIHNFRRRLMNRNARELFMKYNSC